MNALAEAAARVRALPTFVQIGLLALLGAQLALQVYAVVRAVRTPQERLTLARWLWIVIIVAGEILGPIIFLVAGVKPAAVEDVRPTSDAASRAAAAADELYGAPRSTDGR